MLNESISPHRLTDEGVSSKLEWPKTGLKGPFGPVQKQPGDAQVPWLRKLKRYALGGRPLC